MILLYHLIPKMFTLLILCRRLLLYDGFRQKTHFLKCYTLIYFYFLTRSLNCLWILTWVQKPICCSRAGVLHKVYCFSRPTKKVYHEVYIFQIPLLCYKWQQLFMPLYIRYGFSSKVYFLLHPLTNEQNIKKRSSFISESSDVILSVVSIQRDPVTW